MDLDAKIAATVALLQRIQREYAPATLVSTGLGNGSIVAALRKGHEVETISRITRVQLRRVASVHDERARRRGNRERQPASEVVPGVVNDLVIA